MKRPFEQIKGKSVAITVATQPPVNLRIRVGMVTADDSIGMSIEKIFGVE